MKKLLILMILFPLVCFGQTRPHYSQVLGGPLTDVRAYGAKGDGVTDDFSAITAALESEEGLWFPPGTYTIGLTPSARRFNLRSGHRILLHADAVIKLLPHSLTHYEIFQAGLGADGVVIEGGTLDGSKSENSSGSGEWGMGVAIRGAKNVTVRNMNIINTWGDGVYVAGSGGEGEHTPATNLTLENLRIIGCRRQGISVISVDGLSAKNIYIEDIKGTNPRSGIDLEPNHSWEKLERIRFDGVRIHDVHSGGIISWASSVPMDAVFNDVHITSAHYGIGILGGFRNTNDQPHHQLVFNNVTVEDVVTRIVRIDAHRADSYPITINNLVGINGNIAQNSNYRPIHISNATTTWDVGNIHVNNVFYDFPSPQTPKAYMSIAKNDPISYRNISLTNPRVSPNKPVATQDHPDCLIYRAITEPSLDISFVNSPTWGLPLRSTIVVDVSEESPHDPLTDILLNLGKNRINYGYGRRSVELRIPDDGVIEQQTIISSPVDLGWVSIAVATSTPVTVDRSFLTGSFQGRRPAFGFRYCSPPNILMGLSLTGTDPSNTAAVVYEQTTGTPRLLGNFSAPSGRALQARRAIVDVTGSSFSGGVDISIAEGSYIMGADSTGTVSGATVNTPSAGGLFLR